ncbi:MAG: AAA family ATPase [Anaerolineaceae bacterium]|nr:AAA family ATPase [Anaerolineaceae bacterium]
MKFYGREEQLKKLHREITMESMRVMMIYGRRRIGKSELIKQVIRQENIKSIYYECKQTSEKNNTESLSQVVSESFLLPKLAFSGIEELIDYIFNISEKENILFILDEYPFLKAEIKGLDSILQSIIDRHKNTAHIKFVLLGSYVETMKNLLDHSNPLFGRIDLTINLQPMDYYESAMFYNSFSNEDKVRLYAVFGGIPYYNSLINERLSIRENIIDLIASPDARLSYEIPMYLKAEMSKMTNANEVFETLAKGFSRYNDLLTKSHVSSGPTLADILEKLIKMEVVKKISPINDENNRKKTGYYISDNLSLFYYRYIFRYSSQMNIMDPDVFFDRYIRDDFESYYVPLQFEVIGRQYLIRQNKKGNISPLIEKIGKYYYDDPVTRTNGEFDIVTLDENGYIFYEAKFKSSSLSTSAILNEIEQVKASGLDCYRYGFISRSGFTEKSIPNVKYIELADLYQ